MTSLSSEKRISLDLMSGSDDGIRTALGGFYFETSSSSGRTFTFEPYVQKRPANKHISQARYRISDEYLQAVDSSTLMPKCIKTRRISRKQRTHTTWISFR